MAHLVKEALEEMRNYGFCADKSTPAMMFKIQTEKFVSLATDHEFRRRFPMYKGKRQNFSYAKTEHTQFEQEVRCLAHGPTRMPPRVLRQIYRRTVLREQEKRQAEHQSPPDDTPPTTTEEKRKTAILMTHRPEPTSLHLNKQAVTHDCTHCLMKKLGIIFIQEGIICACNVDIRVDKVTVEPENVQVVSTPLTGDYERTLMIGTALSHVSRRQPTQDTQTLEEKMESELLSKEVCNIETVPVEQTVPLTTCKQDDTLQCEEVSIPPLNDGVSIKLTTPWESERGNVPREIPVRKSLIFAPPKSGKTCFQHMMMEKNIAIIDTEDCPNATPQDVLKMLERSTVITNRLDLITNQQIETQKIVFLPKTADILYRMIPKVGITTVRKWWDAANAFGTRDPNTTLILFEKTKLNDWFSLD